MSTDTSRKLSTIRKWYGSWGIAHTFVSPNTPPQKFFIHINNRKSPETVLAIGVRISFVEGEPRTAGELPQALDIDLAPPLPEQPVRKADTLTDPQTDSQTAVKP